MFSTWSQHEPFSASPVQRKLPRTRDACSTCKSVQPVPGPDDVLCIRPDIHAGDAKCAVMKLGLCAVIVRGFVWIAGGVTDEKVILSNI